MAIYSKLTIVWDQLPSLVFGRDSKADRGVRKLIVKKKKKASGML